MEKFESRVEHVSLKTWKDQADNQQCFKIVKSKQSLEELYHNCNVQVGPMIIIQIIDLMDPTLDRPYPKGQLKRIILTIFHCHSHQLLGRRWNKVRNKGRGKKANFVWIQPSKVGCFAQVMQGVAHQINGLDSGLDHQTMDHSN